MRSRKCLSCYCCCFFLVIIVVVAAAAVYRNYNQLIHTSTVYKYMYVDETTVMYCLADPELSQSCIFSDHCLYEHAGENVKK